LLVGPALSSRGRFEFIELPKWIKCNSEEFQRCVLKSCLASRDRFICRLLTVGQNVLFVYCIRQLSRYVEYSHFAEHFPAIDDVRLNLPVNAGIILACSRGISVELRRGFELAEQISNCHRSHVG